MPGRSPQTSWWIPALMAAGLMLIAYLGWGIWDQVERLQRIQAAQAELAPYLERERAIERALSKELEEVSSPAYVEKWARERLGMAFPGEVRVVLPPAEPPTDLPPAHAPVSTDAPVSPWGWLRVLLGGGD